MKILPNKTKKFQFIFKTGILIFITYIAIAHQLKGIMGAPPIHSFLSFRWFGLAIQPCFSWDLHT